jgi:hypothetical protein
MPDKYHALRIVLIATLLPAILAGKTDSARSELTEQTLKAVADCIARSPGDWPDGWKQEYLETIRKAVESHRDDAHYTLRLEILREGFEPCWGLLLGLSLVI